MGTYLLEIGQDFLANTVFVKIRLYGGYNVVDDGAVNGRLNLRTEQGHISHVTAMELLGTDWHGRAAHHNFIGHDCESMRLRLRSSGRTLGTTSTTAETTRRRSRGTHDAYIHCSDSLETFAFPRTDLLPDTADVPTLGKAHSVASLWPVCDFDPEVARCF